MDLESAKARRVVTGFSAPPAFVKTVRDFGNDTGMNFSETLRFLVKTGLQNTTNLETLRAMASIRDEVAKLYREDNRQAYGGNVMPNPRPKPGMPDNLSESVKRKMGLGETPTSTSDKASFEALYG